MKIQSIYGNTLFEDSSLTIKETLEAAVKEGADLRGADLQNADLQYADLQYADLQYADLRGADLRGAYLRGADLQGADLQNADLQGANLQNADLQGADLQYADLQYADLRGAKSFNFLCPEFQRTRILPEGSLIGWKICQNGVLVKLRIPEESKRSHAFGRKCRAEYADVLEVIGASEAFSVHDGGKTVYKVGTRVYPDGFSDDWQQECAPGIHFFITRAEAEYY